MISQTYLPADQWDTLVDALVDAHGDLDPRNAIIVALAEIGFIVPDTCREAEPEFIEGEPFPR